ncbi:hypothetical protein M3Y97_00452300 [Aphelenchoides bicaudatus]|nr:hypothetical protein M3Y97_00452300 [Aphelenchoides bicaudatus]
MLQFLHGVLGFKFGELKLDEGKLNAVEQKIECSFVPPACANWFHVPIYKWSNEKLYIDLMFLTDSFSVYSFDPKNGQASPTRLAALGREGYEGSIIDMHIDENEVITVAANGNSTFPNRWPLCIYRYPTKKPDTLQNIVWQRVRRSTMQMPGQDYAKVIDLLPKNSPLLPFSKKLR